MKLFFKLISNTKFQNLMNIMEKREIYQPESVLDLLGKLNIVYRTNKRRNPNELILFILNRLHEELNIINKNNNQIIYPNIYDKDNVIQCTLKNIQFNCSIITNNLSWFELKELMCSQCGKCAYNLLSFNIFELDIFMTYLMMQKKPITINDCLQVYESPKQQKLFCQSCRNYTNFFKKSKIFSPPNTFIFSLDRKNIDKNLIQIPFIINDSINISNFIESKNLSGKYQLTGIVSFYKNEDKYISFCMSPVDKKWYK